MAKNEHVLNGSNPFSASTWKNTSWASSLYIHTVSDFKHIKSFNDHSPGISQKEGPVLSPGVLQFGKKGREKVEMETGLYWWNYCQVKTLSPIFFHLLSRSKSRNCTGTHCLQNTDSIPRAGHPWCRRNSQRETMKSVKVIPKNELNKAVSNEYQLCMAERKPFKGTCVWTYFPSQQRFRFFTLHNDNWKKLTRQRDSSK